MAGADTIRLKRSVLLNDATTAIELQDIAILTGPIALEAKNLVITTVDEQRALSSSETIEITLADVRRALASNRIHLGRIAMSGAQCRITLGTLPTEIRSQPDLSTKTDQADTELLLPGDPASRFENEPTLRGQIVRVLLGRLFGRQADALRLQFSEADTSDLELPTALFDFEITTPASGTSPKLPIQIRVYQGDQLVRSLRIVADVSLHQEVWIATRYIARGETIGPDDFVLQMRVVKPHPVSPELSDVRIDGKESRTRIVQGQILRRGQTIDPVMVRRNEEVTIEFKSGPFVIREPGRALDSGRTGDIVRVRPLTRSVELHARIIAPGTLSIINHNSANTK